MNKDQLEIGLPNKIAVGHDGGDFVITRTWFGPKILFLTAFVLFWDGFIVFWYFQAFSIGSGAPGNMSLLMKIFPLLHVGVGLWLTYYVFAGYLNKTIIRVNHQHITIRHRPLPYWGQKTVSSADLKQLYSKEKISSGRRSQSVSYEVHALTRGGRNVKIVSGLESSEQAIFIEQEIEKYLRIKDQVVRGEIGR